MTNVINFPRKNPVQLQTELVDCLRKIAKESDKPEDWEQVTREYFKLTYIKDDYENEISRKNGQSNGTIFNSRVLSQRYESEDVSN